MIYLLGAGGHCKVVLDALTLSGVAAQDISIRDGDQSRRGEEIFGIRIEYPEIGEAMQGAQVHVAVGSAAVRAHLYGLSSKAGALALSIRHPSAHISPRARLDEGSFVASGAVVAPDAHVGAAVIVNHGAVVDHDCIVGAYCHVAPNATLGGGVTLGPRVFVGSGAVVLPGLCIGEGSTVGAGAVVTRHVGSNEVWAGVPAARMTTN